jgi:hypothetical protein
MQLRDYQQDIATRAVDILKNHGICYLSMQVRTGKTATSLSAAEQYGAQHVLFVTKKKAISSIEDDAAALQVSFQLDVINYEQLHRIGIDYEKFYSPYDFFICDEAHGLGAFPKPSERTKHLMGLVQEKPVILLSGTPTPESWSQLYHQLSISTRSPWNKYGNFYRWAKDYVKVHQRKYSHGMVNDYSSARKDLIDADTKHLFISYTQEEAGFTSLVEEEVLTVKMLDATYKFADALKAKRVITNKEGETVLADTEVKLMQKLHQIYSGTVIIDEPGRRASCFDSTKAYYIRDRFAGKKICVFYKFIAEEIMLRAVFGKRIVDTPEEFNAAGSDSVYISQVQSGREGINLSTADALVMLNIDFSAVSYWQSRARLQTKDRTDPAKVYWVFAEGGIEEKIYKVVQSKKDFTLQYFKKCYGIGIANTKQNHPQAA